MDSVSLRKIRRFGERSKRWTMAYIKENMLKRYINHIDGSIGRFLYSKMSNVMQYWWFSQQFVIKKFGLGIFGHLSRIHINCLPYLITTFYKSVTSTHNPSIVKWKAYNPSRHYILSVYAQELNTSFFCGLESGFFWGGF